MKDKIVDVYLKGGVTIHSTMTIEERKTSRTICCLEIDPESPFGKQIKSHLQRGEADPHLALHMLYEACHFPKNNSDLRVVKCRRP